MFQKFLQYQPKMVLDLLMQATMILASIFMFLWMQKIPQNLFTKFRYRNRSSYTAKRHFIDGAQLLARSRSTADRAAAAKLAKAAAEEADKSISLDPKDAAAHILKALALEIQGFRTSALEAMDVALSPLTAASLSDDERGEALFKRAEIKVRANKRAQVDSAVKDLVESVRLREDNAAALRLLGECYEKKEMVEAAVKAYEGALAVEPESSVARVALNRLGALKVENEPEPEPES